jgi:hypothetical protein
LTIAEAKAANESGNGLLDNKENGPAVEVEMKLSSSFRIYLLEQNKAINLNDVLMLYCRRYIYDLMEGPYFQS